MPRLLRPTLLAAVASLGVASSAYAGPTYEATISGEQTVSWSVSGTQGDCEVRQGTGSGKVTFRFASDKPGFTSLNPSGGGASLILSLPSTATGSIRGEFRDLAAEPCEGFEPDEPVVEPTDACGPTKFGVRVDAQLRGKTLYVTGPPVPPSDIGAGCPFPLGGPIDDTSDRKSCGEGRALWQRSFGVSSAAGAGLLASQVTLRRSALRKRTVRIKGTESVRCTIGSSYSGGVELTGKLRYVLTLKRTG